MFGCFKIYFLQFLVSITWSCIAVKNYYYYYYYYYYYVIIIHSDSVYLQLNT
jgi:hypothetical protein